MSIDQYNYKYLYSTCLKKLKKNVCPFTIRFGGYFFPAFRFFDPSIRLTRAMEPSWFFFFLDFSTQRERVQDTGGSGRGKSVFLERAEKKKKLKKQKWPEGSLNTTHRRRARPPEREDARVDSEAGPQEGTDARRREGGEAYSSRDTHFLSSKATGENERGGVKGKFETAPVTSHDISERKRK